MIFYNVISLSTQICHFNDTKNVESSCEVVKINDFQTNVTYHKYFEIVHETN